MDNMTIYNAVRRVPDEAKKPIKAGRLKGMTDINPMWRIKSLTEQFGACGIGWYYEVTEKDYHTINTEVVVTVDINLYIKVDGEWSKPIYGTGGSKMASMEKNGLYVNDEAVKMATTDAISVAAKSLGMAADVYWNNDNTKYNDQKKNNTDYSAEEKAMYQQMKTTKVDKVQAITLEGLANSYGADIPGLLKYFKVNSFEEMTEMQCGQCKQMLIAKYEKKKGKIGAK